MSYHKRTSDIEVEIEPTHTSRAADGTVVTVVEGDEVFVRGIGSRMLGIGRFAGCAVLYGPDGSEVLKPLLEVQGETIGGSEVDLWTSDPTTVEKYRVVEIYPIKSYLAERAAWNEHYQTIVDEAIARSMGISLD